MNKPYQDVCYKNQLHVFILSPNRKWNLQKENIYYNNQKRPLHLTKEDMWTFWESWIILQKFIERNLNKCTEISLWRRVNIVIISILPKLISMFNKISTKFTSGWMGLFDWLFTIIYFYLSWIKWTNCNIYMKKQRAKEDQDAFEEKKW